MMLLHVNNYKLEVGKVQYLT